MNCKEPIIENMQNMGTLRTTEGDAWQPIKVLNKEFYDGEGEGDLNDVVQGQLDIGVARQYNNNDRED